MKQPSEYSVESTEGLTAAWGFASDCILKRRKGGGKRTKQNQLQNTKARKLLGSDQKYSYKIIATELSHPGDKKCFMQISYTYEMQSG